MNAQTTAKRISQAQRVALVQLLTGANPSDVNTRTLRSLAALDLWDDGTDTGWEPRLTGWGCCVAQQARMMLSTVDLRG